MAATIPFHGKVLFIGFGAVARCALPIFVRHVKGIQFDNIEIRTDKDDLRPAFVLDSVEDADFFRIKVPHAAGAPVFALHNVSDFTVHMCGAVPDTQLKNVETKTL